MSGINITRSITLHDWEIVEVFVRASGPGGQNVNKTSSAVQLRFNVAGSPSLPERVRARILGSGDSRLTKDGEIVIHAERHRAQDANRRDALERLKKLIRDASVQPRKRIATRPTLGSQKRRLQAKKQRGEIKQKRGAVRLD